MNFFSRLNFYRVFQVLRLLQTWGLCFVPQFGTILWGEVIIIFFFFLHYKKKKEKKTTLCEPVGEYSMIIWQKMQQISTGISRAFALWCSNDLRQRPVTEPVVCYFHNYSITIIKVYDMFRTLDPLYKTLAHKFSFTRLLTKKYHSDNCENVHSIL